MKKVISILLALIMALSFLSVFAFAQESKDIPWIFIHGMNGYGENSEKFEETPYWGKADNDLFEHLRSEGYEVYAPTIGPMSSSWDRACELYAQLMGTVVDYGEAHSEKYGHLRYGRDYTGKAIMGKAWDMESKLNLIAHSLGGPTMRIFISLLAYGDPDEIAASTDDISPLFEGGHDNVINAAVTLAAPHNGTHLADFGLGTGLIPFAVSVVSLFAKKMVNDFFMLEQWEIVTESGALKIANAIKFAKQDNSGYDITLQGAKELTERFKLPDSVLYISYSASNTKDGITGHQVPLVAEGVYTLTSGMIISLASRKYDGFKPGKDWEANDGLVPVISARYPLYDTLGHADYTDGMTLERGIWYAMPTIKGTHSYFTGYFKNASEEYFIFFDGIMNLVTSQT